MKCFCWIVVLAFALPLRAADTPTRIYVYANWGSPQHSWISIYCDGALVAKLKEGKFFAINTTHGRHSLLAGDGVPASVDVGAGEQIFVDLEHNVAITPSGKSSVPVLSIEPPEAARVRVIHLVYIDEKHISSPLVSRRDPTLQWEPSLKSRKH